jgi:starch-binding outer membrane protein, SusD/RagB family
MKLSNFIKIKTVLVAAIYAMLLLSGCSKEFLNRAPEDQIVADNFYTDATRLRMATSALYCRPWWDFNWPFIYEVGDIMSGNTYHGYNPYNTFVSFAISSGDDGLKYGWSSLYNVVANSNTAIINIETLSSADISETDKKAALAEAHFMRGVAYFYLVRVWGPVPIITNNGDLAQEPKIPRIIESDIYKFILEDLKYACKYLKSEDTPGRVTSWSAKGMVAKVYLTLAGKNQNAGTRNQADLDSAKVYAGDVCKNSGLALLKNYYDLFLRANNNNEETLFSLQWVASKGWGSQNWWQSYLMPDGAIADCGDGNWASGRVSYDLYQCFKSGDSRRKATFMLTGDDYPEFITKSNPNGYSISASTNTWSDAGIKKYVIGGPLAPGNDNSIASMQTDIHTYILRLADVYLTYAEAILGNNSTSSDEDALKYFNLVRKRAGLAEVASITRDSILNERRCEFALEGQFWFDLLRLHDYNPQAAIELISKQNRASFSYNASTGETAAAVYNYTPTEADFSLPYPAVDVTKNPKLLEDPVSYY